VRAADDVEITPNVLHSGWVGYIYAIKKALIDATFDHGNDLVPRKVIYIRILVVVVVVVVVVIATKFSCSKDRAINHGLGSSHPHLVYYYSMGRVLNVLKTVFLINIAYVTLAKCCNM
jgi:hypothetical protein